ADGAPATRSAGILPLQAGALLWYTCAEIPQMGYPMQSMVGKAPPFNPLALAVMALLHERPMHPYEIACTMRRRHLEESIKLNYGALYHMVDTLQHAGLIASVETERAGRRPERTVYALTAAG